MISYINHKNISYRINPYCAQSPVSGISNISNLDLYRLSKLLVNMNKCLCCEKLFFNEFLQESKGGSYSYRVCIYESLFIVTTDKTYFIIITKELHQNKVPSLGKKPLEVGFKKPEPLPDNTKAGQCITELTLSEICLTTMTLTEDLKHTLSPHFLV